MRLIVLAAAATLTLLAAPAGATGYLGDYHTPLHPVWAYDGTAGRVDVAFCPATLDLYRATRNVVAALNRRDGTPGNIVPTGDPSLPPAGKLDAEHVLLHEIGHALGFGHSESTPITLNGVAPDFGVAVSTLGINGVLDAQQGSDGIFGSEDDMRGDDENVTLFPLTTLGNTPFIVPDVVDSTTLSIDRWLRQSPGTWPYVSWEPVAALLGLPPTVSQMFTVIRSGKVTRRPAPADITLLRYSEAGADRRAGTDDDYQYHLFVVPPGQGSPTGQCIAINMSPDMPWALAGQTDFGFGFRYADACIDGSGQCFRLSVISLNNKMNWHYPSTDTSSGEADYVPAPSRSSEVIPSDEVVTVAPGLVRQVSFTARTKNGEPFPAGTTFHLRSTNGVFRPLTPAMTGGSASVAGVASAVFDAEVEGDSTPSAGSLFGVIEEPNQARVVGRIGVVDIAEVPTVSLVPERVQLPKTLRGSDAPTIIDVLAKVRYSQSGAPVDTLVETDRCVADSLQGAVTTLLSACETGVNDGCAVNTDANGDALLTSESYSDEVGVQSEALQDQLNVAIAVRAQPPELALVADITGGTAAGIEAGETITLSVIATNTGVETLNFATVSMNAPLDASDCTPAIPLTLEPGGVITCSRSVTPTQEDVDTRNPIVIAASASGSTNDGQTAFASVERTRAVDGRLPALVATTLAALDDSSVVNDAADAGEVVHFDATITNTGGVTVTDMDIAVPGSADMACTPAVGSALAPGASMACSYSYTVTPADVAAGGDVAPALAATGTADVGSISATASDAVAVASTEGVLLLDVVAGLDDANPNGTAEAGERIDYTLTLRNDGDTVLDAVAPGLDIGGALACAPAAGASLLPGEGMTCTSAYTVTYDDQQSQRVIFGHATANATVRVTGDAVSVQDTARTATLFSEGHMTFGVDVTVVGRPAGSVAELGDTVQYRFELRNTGGRSLINVKVEPTIGGPICITSLPDRLEPGESLICNRELVVGPYDAMSGEIQHVASALSVPFIPLAQAGEARCRVTAFGWHAIAADLVVGFDPATGTLAATPASIQLTSAQIAARESQAVVIEARDQLGEPLTGFTIDMDCTNPTGNRLAVNALPATVDASGFATVTLTLQDRGAGQAELEQAATCVVRSNGFEASVRVAARSDRIFRAGFEGL